MNRKCTVPQSNIRYMQCLYMQQYLSHAACSAFHMKKLPGNFKGTDI